MCLKEESKMINFLIINGTLALVNIGLYMCLKETKVTKKQNRKELNENIRYLSSIGINMSDKLLDEEELEKRRLKNNMIIGLVPIVNVLNIISKIKAVINGEKVLWFIDK